MTKSAYSPWIRRLYWIAMIVIVFTGFGQMPIFKRYAIIEVPGLAWSGNFFNVIQVHYAAGLVLLLIGGYMLVDYFLARRGQVELTKTGWLRALLMIGVLLTGLVAMYKNLAGVVFSHGWQLATNFSHLTLAMIFLFLSLGCAIARVKWRKANG